MTRVWVSNGPLGLRSSHVCPPSRLRTSAPASAAAKTRPAISGSGVIQRICEVHGIKPHPLMAGRVFAAAEAGGGAGEGPTPIPAPFEIVFRAFFFLMAARHPILPLFPSPRCLPLSPLLFSPLPGPRTPGPAPPEAKPRPAIGVSGLIQRICVFQGIAPDPLMPGRVFAAAEAGA